MAGEASVFAAEASLLAGDASLLATEAIFRAGEESAPIAEERLAATDASVLAKVAKRLACEANTLPALIISWLCLLMREPAEAFAIGMKLKLLRNTS